MTLRGLAEAIAPRVRFLTPKPLRELEFTCQSKRCQVTVVGSPRGPYQSGIRRRREIVDAASRVFARYGYTGGSLRQIANDVGVTPAALTRHFDNKEGLLQAVLDHWESDNISFFDGAHGLEYFRRLPLFIAQHRAEPGLIELLLTLATEATDPQHPARKWATERYQRTIALGVRYLREACALGEILPMDDNQLEVKRAAYMPSWTASSCSGCSTRPQTPKALSRRS